LEVPLKNRAELLSDYRLFNDDERFLEQQTSAVQALAMLPAYVLRYSDPADAATRVQDLLAAPRPDNFDSYGKTE
jgi:hypothetical protein